MYTVSEKVQFIQQAFGTGVISRSGTNIAVSCPSCDPDRKKKKFSICLETDQNHCWSCEMKGRNLFSILGKFFSKEMQASYKQKFLNTSCFSSSEEEEREETLRLPDEFVLLCQNQESKDPDIKSAIRYCEKRGMTKKDLWFFKTGTCKSGRHRRKVIFPSFSSEGLLNYYVSRSIDDIQRKYSNADVKKTEIIFNEINIDWKKELTIVEGPFDAIKCNLNTTCLLGSDLSITSRLFTQIVKNQTDILIGLDSDMKKKTQNISKLLSEYGINVRILDLGSFPDVGEMTKEDFLQASAAAKPWNSSDRLHTLIRAIKSGSVF